MRTTFAALFAFAISGAFAQTMYFEWFSDYACEGSSIGTCEGNGPGTCCTPPGYTQSVYAYADDGGVPFSFTMNSEANCDSPVAIYTWSQNSDGSGCYGASDASVGSVTIGEFE